METDNSAELGSQVIEEFWGLELSKNKKELKWEEDEEDDIDCISETVLELRQACLGAGAKEGERNVVEVTTENMEGDMVTHSILSLRAGGTEQSTLFLTLHSPVTFKLAQGNGPVHVVGQRNRTLDMSMIDSDDEEDEEDEEADETTTAQLALAAKNAIASAKKRPASSPLKAPAKVAKVDNSKDVNNGDNWGDDSEDDDDYEDENSEEDDDSEDEEIDEEDSEEESEEPPKPAPKKSQGQSSKVKSGPTPNGKPAPNGKPTPNGKPLGGKTGVAFKTPQPQKSGKKQKGTQSLPVTPFDSKKNQGKGTSDLNDIKQKLLKMSIPKKLEKFNNFISNSFKIKDAAVKKQLWEYVQKNKAQ